MSYNFEEDRKGENQSRWWQASPGGNGMYDVKHGSEGFVVDILEKTCTCGAWLCSGIPCFYALTVMREKKLNPTPFIDGCYSVEMPRNTYTHTLQVCNHVMVQTCGLQRNMIPLLPLNSKRKRQVTTVSKGGQRKGKQDLLRCMELCLEPKGESSALFVAAMAITRRCTRISAKNLYIFTFVPHWLYANVLFIYFIFFSHQVQLPQVLLLQLSQVVYLNLRLLLLNWLMILLLLMLLLVTQLILLLLVMLIFIINWGGSQSREHRGVLKAGRVFQHKRAKL